MSRFDGMYAQGTPPWEIGRPQSAVVELARAGKIKGRVLDLGCGTGENALLLAAEGCKVVGVDSARTAIAAAQRKAGARSLAVEFLVHDALSVSALAARFDVVLDSGFFHTLSDEQRVTYREELANVMSLGGSLFVLCMSDQEPDWGGPRRVREAELRDTFKAPFFVESVAPSRYELVREQGAAQAWLTTATYVGTSKAMLS